MCYEVEIWTILAWKVPVCPSLHQTTQLLAYSFRFRANVLCSGMCSMSRWWTSFLSMTCFMFPWRSAGRLRQLRRLRWLRCCYSTRQAGSAWKVLRIIAIIHKEALCCQADEDTNCLTKVFEPSHRPNFVNYVLLSFREFQKNAY